MQAAKASPQNDFYQIQCQFYSLANYNISVDFYLRLLMFFFDLQILFPVELFLISTFLLVLFVNSLVLFVSVVLSL